MIADLGGLADDNARRMVDEEVLANFSTGVDVDAGAAVRILGHDARHQRHIKLVELVGNAINPDCEEARVRVDDLFLRLSSRVTVEGCLDILVEQLLNRGNLAQHRRAHLTCALVDFLECHLVAIAEQQSLAHLLDKVVLDAQDGVADKVLRIGRRLGTVAEIPREHDVADVLEDFDDDIASGHMPVGVGEENLVRRMVVVGNR